MGPTLIPGDFTSGQIIKKMLCGELPVAPKVMFPVVDVASVARAHFLGASMPEIGNQRFILCNRMVWMKHIADTLAAAYGQYGYKPPKKELSSYCAAWMLSSMENEIKLMLPLWGLEWEITGNKSREVMGLEYPDMDKVMVDFAASLIDYGVIPEKRNGEQKKK